MASVLGTSTGVLTERVEADDRGRPRWAVIDTIEVDAQTSGVVESLDITNGSWADETSAVVTVVQPDRVRFHAQGLQSDMGLLRDGLSARIVPPVPTRAGSAIDLQDTMPGTVSLGLNGDPNDRTIDLYVVPETLTAWARPGVSAQLEIVTDETGGATLAIPLAAIQRDGIAPVLFRRDPKDPNKAIRLNADLGLDDRRWSGAGHEEVTSGVRSGRRDG